MEDDWVQAVKATLPELPAERRDRLMRQYGLPAYDAEVLTARKDVADYYEAAVRTYPADPKAISNWVMDSVLRVVKDAKLDTGLRITTWPCPPEHLGTLVRLIGEGTISGKIAKTVFDAMRTSGKAPDTLIAEQGLSQVSDAGALACWKMSRASKALLRRNSNAEPWISFVPDLVTTLTTAPAEAPYSAEKLLV